MEVRDVLEKYYTACATEGTAGRIAIRDSEGFIHEILHSHRQHVTIGDPVVAGQLIGTMGNTGVNSKEPEKGPHHVHYQLRDREGRIVDPGAYWDRQGPIDPDPAPPTHLAAHQRYLRILEANPSTSANQPDEISSVGHSASFDDRFGNWSSSSGVSAPVAPNQPMAPAPPAGRPLGLVTGEPMPDYPFAPTIFGFPGRSTTPGDEDFFRGLVRSPQWNKKRR